METIRAFCIEIARNPIAAYIWGILTGMLIMLIVFVVRGML